MNKGFSQQHSNLKYLKLFNFRLLDIFDKPFVGIIYLIFFFYFLFIF